MFSNVESIVKVKNLFPGRFVWEVCTPLYQVPNVLGTLQALLGEGESVYRPRQGLRCGSRLSYSRDALLPALPCTCALCLHPLIHPLPHAHSTARFCVRAMFQALPYVPGLPFRSWGPGVEGLRNGVVLCSGDTSVSSTRQVLGDQKRALVATWGGRKTPSVEGCHYLLLRL